MERVTSILVAAVLASGGFGAEPVGAVPQQSTQQAPTAQDSAGATAADTSQVQNYVLEPITVVAPRERSTPPPVATIVVDPRELELTPSENPYDLIRRVTGLEVHDQGQGPGFASNVVLRGFTADHSSDLLLVVDGVPVNLPVHGHVEGYADWNYLLPGAISSMRVIHGPSSPLYGDFAIAGAMEVHTKPDAEGTAGQLASNAFGDVSGWVTTGRRGDNGGGMVGLELKRLEGWREHSRQQMGNALLRGWHGVGEGRVEGGLGLYVADWSSPGFLSMADFAARNLDLVANRTDGGDQIRGVLHGRYAGPVGRDRYLQVMGWGVMSDWELFLTVPGHTDALGNLYQTLEADRRWGSGAQVEFSWTPPAGELTVGATARRDWSEYDQSRSLRRVSVEEFVALDAGHASASGYARWRWHPLERLGLDIGGRVDHLRYRSLNRLGLESTPVLGLVEPELAVLPDPDAQPYHPSGPSPLHPLGEAGPVGEWVNGAQTLVSPKVGAELRLTDRWSLMASSSRGFRSAVGVVGDPDRPAVATWAHEVGVDYDGRALGGHLSLFRMDVSNERIQDPLTLLISSAGSSVRQGVEATAEVGLGGGVTLFGRGAYTHAALSGQYADAHDDHNQGAAQTGSADSGSQRVPGVASYLGQLWLEAPLWRDLRGRLEWRVTGPYVPIGEARVTTDPYSTVDAGLGYPVRDRVLVSLEVRNLLDRVYPEIRSSGYVSPGTPRSVSLTLHVLEGAG